MSKSTFKGSLLATTVIAAIAVATPVFAQNQTVPETAPPAPVTPTDTQGNTPPAAPSDQTPPAGIQTNESAAPAEPTSSQEIVITGTLIRNPNLVASAPVTVVGQDEIRLRQNNLAEETIAHHSGRRAEQQRAGQQRQRRCVVRQPPQPWHQPQHRPARWRSHRSVRPAAARRLEQYSARAGRPRRRADRRRFLDLRRGRRRRRHQLHHPQRLLGHGTVGIRPAHPAR